MHKKGRIHDKSGNDHDIINRYADAIHTQDKEDFCSLWADNTCCALISLTTRYQGIEKIYQDFLIGRIQKAYSHIDLIAEHVDIREITDNLAIVVFRYHTECIRRETDEAYGIQGLETQVMIKENGTWKLQHVHYSK